jgi:hypothetical protein
MQHDLNSQCLILAPTEATKSDEQLAAGAEDSRKLKEENVRSRPIARAPNWIVRSRVVSFSPCITWPRGQY